MRVIRLTLLAAMCAVLLPAQSTTGWQLVWSDEFNGSANTAPDPAKWTYDLGGGGWGNGELETYTNSAQNVFQDGNGNLVIRAINSAGNYTSARIKTEGLASFQYGIVEARIKLPFGQGIWPAFWMLGTNITTVSWPMCGEVDIMENFGAWKSIPSQDYAHKNAGTIHGPAANVSNPPDYPPSGIGTSFTLPFGETVYDDYHVYSIQWAKGSIQFFVDGALYETLTPSSLTGNDVWVFDNPFFLILNQAIGGPNTFLGQPDSTTVFPSDMVVDYVRYYQPTTISGTTPVIDPGRVQNAASYLGTMAPGSLVALFGENLADQKYPNPFDTTAGKFPNTVAGVSVSVNGVPAALTYISPTQINFQIPWETAPGPAVNIKVTRNSVDSNVEPVMIEANTSPSMFIKDYNTGAVWVTGCTQGVCTMWGNGFGPKASSSPDGVPWSAGSKTTQTCTLTIGGQAAHVHYCGAAPGEVIDQLNFEYPSGLSGSSVYPATLNIGSITYHFLVPAPQG